MSSSNDPYQPRHREHSDEEPLPEAGKPRTLDYSPQSMERAKLPKSEEGEAQFRGCNCERTRSGTHEQHCHSKLHKMEPLADQKIPTAEGHHFFNEDNPRPKPVGPNEREKVEWFEGQRDPAV